MTDPTVAGLGARVQECLKACRVLLTEKLLYDSVLESQTDPAEAKSTINVHIRALNRGGILITELDPQLWQFVTKVTRGQKSL